MLFSEIVTHDLSKSLPERLKARRFVGPYHRRPSEPDQSLGFFLAMGAGRTAPPQVDAHGSPFKLRLQWSRPEGHRLGGEYSTGDNDPWVGIIAELKPFRDPFTGDFEGRWLAGATLGPGMCAFLEREVYCSPEYASKVAERLAREASEAEEEPEEMDA